MSPTRRSSKHGKTSGSDAADWTEIRIEESGGFAGLRRHGSLLRSELDADARVAADRAIRALAAGVPRAADSYPDMQSLTITIDGISPFALTLDAADLEASVQQLVDLVPLAVKPRK